MLRGLDQQLDAEITMLSRALRPNGTLDRSRIVNLPDFDEAGRGWGWQVKSLHGHWSGGDAIDASLIPRPPHGLEDRYGLPRPGPIPGESVTKAGVPVHTRTLTVPTMAGDAIIVAGGPRHLATAPLREAMVPLLGSLAILGIGLGLAMIAQLRFGLGPLRALHAALADVRAGRTRHVPEDQPDELVPLVAELNALVDQNETQLEHARRHVANLAHGLKTPLATLDVTLAEGGHDPDGPLRAMVADLDRRIRHHLGRARATAPGNRAPLQTVLAPAVDGLAAVMRGVYADRAIGVTIDIASDIAVAADPQDIDEMLGNVLDNAWRHAASEVRVDAYRTGSTIHLTIEDDGPGLPEQLIEEALVPGRRLDEDGDGYGFGLPIAQELAELNGGTLGIGRSAIGGLRTILTLRACVDDR